MEATELIRDIVVPWRRQHAEKMAQLQEMEKFSEIEIKKAELLEKQAITTKVNAESERVQAEAEKIRAEAEKLRLENGRLRLELQRDKAKMAIEILNQLAPSLSESDRVIYLIQLLPSIEGMISSDFEIEKLIPLRC